MNYDVESYERAVDKQWIKLEQTKTSKEIESVLKTWPVMEDYKIKEEEKKEVEKKESDEV